MKPAPHQTLSPPTGPALNGSTKPAQPQQITLPSALPVRQRRPVYLALGLALVLVFSALGAFLYQQAGAKAPVVVVVSAVAQGQVIDRSDLSTIEVAGPVTAVAALNLPEMVGKVATVDLLPNTLLQRSMVGDVPVWQPDMARVGVAVGPGQLPANGVAVGDWVQILQVPDTKSASNTGAPEVLVERARVFDSVPNSSQAGGFLVTIEVPLAESPLVAAASGTGRVALVQVAP